MLMTVSWIAFELRQGFHREFLQIFLQFFSRDLKKPYKNSIRNFSRNYFKDAKVYLGVSFRYSYKNSFRNTSTDFSMNTLRISSRNIIKEFLQEFFLKILDKFFSTKLCRYSSGNSLEGIFLESLQLFLKGRIPLQISTEILHEISSDFFSWIFFTNTSRAS